MSPPYSCLGYLPYYSKITFLCSFGCVFLLSCFSWINLLGRYRPDQFHLGVQRIAILIVVCEWIKDHRHCFYQWFHQTPKHALASVSQHAIRFCLPLLPFSPALWNFQPLIKPNPPYLDEGSHLASAKLESKARPPFLTFFVIYLIFAQEWFLWRLLVNRK